MKLLTASLAFLLSLSWLTAEKIVLESTVDIDWVYTLVISSDSGTENYSLSLMKDGSLAYDQWGSGKELVEQKFDLTPEQYAKLMEQFAMLYDKVAADPMSEKPTSTNGISFTLEKIEDKLSTAFTFTGEKEGVQQVLDAAQPLLATDYPFACATKD